MVLDCPYTVIACASRVSSRWVILFSSMDCYETETYLNQTEMSSKQVSVYASM